VSFEPNTAFLERVADFIDNVEGMSYIPRKASQLLSNQEYEELDKFMTEVESGLSQANFHASGMFSETPDAF
jgi:D-aminopeptidase